MHAAVGMRWGGSGAVQMQRRQVKVPGHLLPPG